MAGRISVTPEELQAQAQTYITARDMVQDAINQVEQTNGAIEQEWNGAAFRAYLEQYNQLKGQVNQFNELLVSINNQLKQYATTVEQRDQEDAQRFGLQ
ncbi:WXG100 family type VII secretion target [Convivina intestini]|uniref:ESAT-6-like protein n=1 Tax=Convivina intestini TaxID=1505726 RepID=A0A2U1D9Q5_9LACO|nr:WXG100 family type VII secretion target [Convivina intestini]PVY84272.1 WXG100 family type VII secretion target [Convivina intestini]CAH1855348.1 ESAT-6-like protein [Convivina intestini]SDB93706.1 WXG100 family type VII secretion target [Leuconostocaceae bacterium R-53105]